MEEVIKVIEEFVPKEYAAWLAFYGEPDDSIFRQKVADVMHFAAPDEDVYLGFSRPPDIGEASLLRMKETLARVVPRVLFQVKRYTHPELGELYRAYLSGKFTYSASKYSSILYLARTGSEIRIVSVDGRCISCAGRGSIGEEPCAECGATGWTHAGGRKLTTFGELMEVRKVRPPANPANLTEYESE